MSAFLVSEGGASVEVATSLKSQDSRGHNVPALGNGSAFTYSLLCSIGASMIDSKLVDSRASLEDSERDSVDSLRTFHALGRGVSTNSGTNL